MKGWGLYGVLLAIAAAFALATQQSRVEISPVPSVENAGPAGTRLLYIYLLEQGHRVSALTEPLTALPEGLKTLVMVAPAGREVTPAEIGSIERFVRDGGQLIYLAARDGDPQRALTGWLGISPPRSGVSQGPLSAVAGRPYQVSIPRRAAAGVRQLQLSEDPPLQSSDPAAVPVAADGALWWKPLGRGEIWLSAGADLAENDRLDRLDNLRFWENVAAQGPLAFDEHHHTAAPAPRFAGALIAFTLQLLACAGLFAWAKGSRLGPPREVKVERHRSTLEYLQSLAALTRSARVEQELVGDALARLRTLLHEALGIATSLPDRAAAVELGRRAALDPAQAGRVFEEARAAAEAKTLSAREYARISRALATIERRVRGLRD